MSAWWVAVGVGWVAGGVGWVAGGITAATWFGVKLTVLVDEAFENGVQAERDGIAPLRPVADPPGVGHPTLRERGVSDVLIVVSALTVAGLVLLASATFGGGG